MGTEQIYDAVLERISKNKKGMDPQHYYIYLAVMIKFVGLIVIVGIAFFMIFDVPQVVAKEIASLPTRPPRPTDIPATATATETPTSTATATATDAGWHVTYLGPDLPAEDAAAIVVDVGLGDHIVPGAVR